MSWLGTPTMRLMALYTASTGPVPSAASAWMLPSGPMSRTVAVGVAWSPQVTCTKSRW